MISEQHRFIFPKQVNDFILENHYIARKMKPGEHLKQYHRYWSSFSNTTFKVMEIYNIDDREYYSIKFPNLLFGEASYPAPNDYMFELKVDYKHIESLNIINSKSSLLGSEIRYWFVINNIDLNDSIYSGFWSYLDYNSKSSISDDKYYFVKRAEDSYCYISIDKFKKNFNIIH